MQKLSRGVSTCVRKTVEEKTVSNNPRGGEKRKEGYAKARLSVGLRGELCKEDDDDEGGRRAL